jgi:hypothetical protein
MKRRLLPDPLNPRNSRLFFSWTKNRQGEDGEQNTDQRTRDGEPKRNTPARIMDRASSISMPIVFFCLHGTEPAPNASFFIPNRAVSQP